MPRFKIYQFLANILPPFPPIYIYIYYDESICSNTALKWKMCWKRLTNLIRNFCDMRISSVSFALLSAIKQRNRKKALLVLYINLTTFLYEFSDQFSSYFSSSFSSSSSAILYKWYFVYTHTRVRAHTHTHVYKFSLLNSSVAFRCTR